MVQVMDRVVEIGLLGAVTHQWTHESVATFVISSPFILFAMMMFRHQAMLQDQLTVLARTDSLTGLPNRRDFLENAAENPGLGGGVLLMIDVDHFKQLNDTYGHGGGDHCLRAVAKRMRDLAGPEDVIGRLGGEEFVMFLPHADLAEARTMGAALTTDFGVRLKDGTPLALTTSVGVARGGPKLSLPGLMQRADEALYSAKGKGRAQVVVWSGTLARLVPRPSMETPIERVVSIGR